MYQSPKSNLGLLRCSFKTSSLCVFEMIVKKCTQLCWPMDAWEMNSQIETEQTWACLGRYWVFVVFIQKRHYADCLFITLKWPKVYLRMTLLEDLVLHSNQNPKAVIFNEYYTLGSHMFVIHFVLYIEKISVLKCQTLIWGHFNVSL